MNTRERFHATMNFESLDRPLFWEFGYWAPALKRWYEEGLPGTAEFLNDLSDDDTVFAEVLAKDWMHPYHDSDVNRMLGFDESMMRLPLNNLFCPKFEVEVLEDHQDWYRILDPEGQIVEISKLNGSRRHLETVVKTREDYERLKEERLQPGLKERLPENWSQIKEELKTRTFPLMIGGRQGFFNQPRRLLGFERLMVAYTQEPSLVKDIINDTADLLIAIYDPILSEIDGDLALISEDMCYRSGCFISPELFQEFMMPAYKKLTGFYRDHGISTILVDCDGDVMKLIPLLIEGGVTGLFPFEVTGNCDIVKVREQFPRFQILGGIDKKMVAMGKAEIDAELKYKIPRVFKGGGFVPFIDHTVPPEISWENFCYYRRRLAELAVPD